MATILQVRDDCRALIAGLAAITARSITPRAMWVPERARDENLPDVIIAPAEREVRLEGRGVRADAVLIQVGICEALADDPEAAAAAGHVLADAIIDGLLGVRIGGDSNAICYSAKHLVLTVPQNWRELRQLTTVLELAFKGF